MKLQQLIAAGFAITAITALSIPAVRLTLLGETGLERPAVNVQASWEADPFIAADASLQRVVMQGSRSPKRTDDKSPQDKY
jgi:hypothetical protein